MPKIKCIGCGKSKIINDKLTLETIVNHGFNYVWDISHGLVGEMICNECAEEIRKHVHAIEDIIKIQIDFLSLRNYSKLNKL